MSIIKKKAIPKSLRGYTRSKPGNTGRKISDVATNVFRNGTILKPLASGKLAKVANSYNEIIKCPYDPADIFAFTAHLLNVCGAFGYFSAALTDPQLRNSIELWLSKDEVKNAISAGSKWKKAYYTKYETPPDEVTELWAQLISYWNWPINCRIYVSSETFPEWWKIAYFLMITSDEAASGIGFANDSSVAQHFKQMQNKVVVQAKDVKSELGGPEGEQKLNSLRPTICNVADPDVVCVQPKALVSEVGSSSRVFSHNLALLGPRGVVRTQWARLNDYSETLSSDRGLNLLIIPIPDLLESKHFVSRSAKKKFSKNGRNWRTFELEQEWLKSGNYGELTEKLVNDAISQGEEIHGVIFPELSLSSNQIRDISLRLDAIEGVEFVIAGSSDHCEGKEGNFVWCERFDSIPAQNAKAKDYLSGLGFVQSKHHRWKLDSSQIKRYGLKNLQENFDWWEHINVGSRELNFVTFRSESIFSALICEDLARSEPCHEILRAIGPNLLFALLMDGPQISGRWPARYASYLSEDPGMSVMTVTSRGLSKLSNPDCDLCTIAYFSDGQGDVDSRAEISIPDVASATLVKLIPKPRMVTSIDGRKKELENWILASSNPVSHLIEEDNLYKITVDEEFNKTRLKNRRDSVS